MKMNILYNYTTRCVVTLLLVFLLSACNDGFMERLPETEITERAFFNTPNDLETYTNGFYEYLDPPYNDAGSDNVVYIEDGYIYKLMRGELNPRTVGKWGNWDKIRNVNFMLVNAHKAVGNTSEINNHIGVARLFRAYLYYDLVKAYSDVPWYSKPLETTDEELLYKTQDSRVLVVDSIMADLEYAVNHIEDNVSKTRFNKWSALAMQARIALHEGTYRKYHSELNLNDGDKYIKLARDAAKQIIDSGNFSISLETIEGLGAYESMFCNTNLSQNPEMIMFMDYDKSLRHTHNAKTLLNYNFGFSRLLVEDYLVVKDGKAFPFQQLEGYDKIGFLDIHKDRDPRLNQSMMNPGFKQPEALEPERMKPGLGGYPQTKFFPLTYDQLSWSSAYTDLPIFRLAEIYLIYAEARAELGELNQNDLDMTINHLRSRVKMPPMILTDIQTNIDPVQANRYSNVSGGQVGAILEIRRERRVELACEGFRYDDLFRWKVGHLMAVNMEGAYIDKLGLMDVTGDGDPDIAIVKTQADADAIPQDVKDKYKLTVYILEKETFYLTEGDHGFICMVAQRDKFSFKDPQFYYKPLDEQDMLVNPNLIQNSYWK